MKYTMVIADDEPLVLKSLELLIRKEFPDIEIVGMAENGIELKQMAERLKPDMAIVDVRMPGLTGIEVIELLKNRGCQTHFIINTAFSDFNYVKKALDLKTDGYLLKPGKREESMETIRKLCWTVAAEREENQKQERINSAVGLVSPVLGSEVLLSVFSQKCDENGFQIFCDIHSLHFAYGCIATFVPKVPTSIRTNDLYAQLNETLTGLCNFLTTVTPNGVVVMFLVPEELEPERREDWCRELAFLVAKHLKEKNNADYHYGVGKVYDSFTAMRTSYQDSIKDVRGFGPEEETEGDNRDKIRYISWVKQYVMDNFRKDISLQDCAENVGISPYYLSHIFKEQTGRTLVEYLSMVRIEAAKILSENAELTTKDIAEQCGYPNLTYFCKVFKRLTGMTIGEYRRQQQGKGPSKTKEP